ncbi:MAG TPA: ABC transporter permease [Candidatus Sulfotelmatobacter sp.]|jgi:polar amino acid transport system permease protein|nr:ABC transporter permease [Candidatus Sulfotelmatobacter sp.]
MNLHGFGPQLLAGTLMTLQLAFSAVSVGLVLGLLGAVAKSSRLLTLRLLGEAYTTIVRGVPELLVVLIVYFGSAKVLTGLAGALGFDTYIELDPFAAGTLALGLTFGAYATEVFRGAMLTVPKGQVEAAQSLGLGRWRCFSRIVLPQLWRVALPGLGNLFMVLMKDTALISVVGLDELMRKAQIGVGFSKEPFTFYGCAALIYLVLTVVTGGGLMALEHHANRGYRRARS